MINNVAIKSHKKVSMDFGLNGDLDKYKGKDIPLDERIKLIEQSGLLDRFRDFSKLHHTKVTQTEAAYKHHGLNQEQNAKANNTIKSHSFDELIGKMKKKNAIGVAYGPSLKKQIKYLGLVKYDLIAADRAMSYLFEHGIKAKYYCTSDSYTPAHWIPDNIDLRGSHLIAFIGAGHEFVKKFYQQGGNVYFFNINCMIGSTQHLGGEYYLPASGYVGQAVIATAFSCLNVRRLYLVGYDFSWQDNNYYPEGGNYPGKEETKEFRSITGEIVKTVPTMITYLQYTNEYLRHGGFLDRCINCTDGGIMFLKRNKKLSEVVRI